VTRTTALIRAAQVCVVGAGFLWLFNLDTAALSALGLMLVCVILAVKS